MERQTGDVTRHIFGRMQAGDREAFDHFFERNTPRVLVYINYNIGRRLRSKLDPADILQNLYLNLYKNFESFSRRAQKRGIHKTLIRMADHEITEAYRFHFKVDKRDAKREVAAAYRDENMSSHSPIELVPSTATSMSQRVVRQEEYQRVMRMLSELSPYEQYVTVSRVIEGLSAREIGDQLGKSRNAIQMTISRVRDKLRGRAELDRPGPE